MRFTAENGINHPINSSWHFFETLYQSGLYWNFIGWGQLIAGLLLMTQRYAKLGALVFLPIITNIFVITISYDFRGTSTVTGLMLLSNITLILWDWDTLKVLINQKPIINNVKRLEQHRMWAIVGLALFLFYFIGGLTRNRTIFIIALISMIIISIYGLVWGIKAYKKGLKSTLQQHSEINSI